MIYYDFINKNKKYFKSVRMIKDYVSFDMSFPKTWSLLKQHLNGIEIIKNNDSDDSNVIISFVTPLNENGVNKIEESIDSIIKYNIEREEKERLFKNKVDELKGIFENQKLDRLKTLKFNIDELTSYLGDEENTIEDDRDRERVDEVREREVEESTVDN